VKTVASFLLIALLSAGLGAQSTAESDRLIARLWLQRAAEILDSDSVEEAQLDEAVEALRVAGEFQFPGADARYLEARLLTEGRRLRDDEDSSTIRDAFEAVSVSLDAERPTGAPALVPFVDQARLFAVLALRLREYRTLLDRYEEWPAGHRDDPELLYAAARAAIYLGRFDEAATMARRGESASDSQNSLNKIVPGLGSAWPEFRALRIAAGDPAAVESLDSAVRLWGSGVSEALEPWILAGFITLDGSSDLDGAVDPTVVRLVDGSSDGMESAVTEGPFRSDLAILRRLRDSGLSVNMAGYTGELVSDADYDGYAEESLRWLNGRPTVRRIDADQDGRAEWELRYDAGRPVQIRSDGGRLSVNYVSGAFPEVVSVSRFAEDDRITVSFRPGRFLWDPSADDPVWGELDGPDWDRGEFWNAARRVDAAFRGFPHVESSTELDSGYPVRAMETRYADETREYTLWIREILYSDGVPIAGRRSYRNRPDDSESPLWELYERYENGRVVGLAWDPGMTGSPAYLRDWALSRYLETQVWDGDLDGWMDARRFILPGGILRERTLLVTEATMDDLLPWRPGEWDPWER